MTNLSINNNMTVSVVIPAFNCEKWIVETINSVLNQSYKNIELIVVNDGSTDNTSIILGNYKNINNVHVYNIDNSGPAIARNYGVAKASGDIIAFLDADDKWTEDKIERQLRFFIDENCKLLLTDLTLINSSNEVIGQQQKVIPKGRKEQTISFFQGRINQNTPTIMVKKSIFNEFGGFDSTLIHKEDHFFLMQVANKYGVNHLKEYLVLRRVWNESMSNNYKNSYKMPEEVISHFKKTRYPFYELSVKKFPYLEIYLEKEIAKFYNTLSHKLYELGHITHSKQQLKKAIKHEKKLKYIIKLIVFYFPNFIRESFMRTYYNK